MGIPTRAVSIVAVVAIAVIILGFIVSRHTSNTRQPAKPIYTQATIRYLPLGDSYTIGQSIAESGRWPNQLVAQLQHQGTSIAILANPAVTGYTTQDLIATELPLVKTLKPNFVTVQIGVNDYFQGMSANEFQKNLSYIIEYLQQNLPAPAKILLVNIPDYGKTPTGAQTGNPATISAGVQQFNSIIATIGQQYQVPVADVFQSSQAVATDSSLVAYDGLHPTAKQYSQWLRTIYPATVILLK